MLKDPETLDIRYVGISMNIEERYKRHVSNPHSNALGEWIAGIPSRPVIEVVLETASRDEQCKEEERLIKMYGHALVNQNKISSPGRRDVCQKETIALRVPVDVAVVLQKMAEEQERSLSWIVAKILRSYVEEMKK